MAFKKFFYGCLLACLLIVSPIVADTWKLFFYMDSSDNLSDMAIKNITDMMRGKPNDTVDVVIQLHAYDSAALRYQVTSAGLTFLEETTISGDGKQDFIDAASWALAHNTADHAMLIFSNHGWGALDPHWNAEAAAWEVAGMGMNNSANTCPLSMTIKKSHHELHKGFMFNAHAHSYLTNQALDEGLAYIQENLLQGNKIDIVAFDTCMGSMLEVATCVAPYAQYLVGVQSCALRDGFDYQGFIDVLNQGIAPRQTCIEFVHAFDKYYCEHDKAGIYTCASLDLKCVDTVNEALNEVVAELLQYPEWIPLIMQARDKTHRFCLWPIYTDLVAFCKLVEDRLLELPTCDAIELLFGKMHTLYSAAETMAIARCGGSTTYGKAYGFSIYLPTHSLENSYLSSLFAQHSQWPHLLTEICK